MNAAIDTVYRLIQVLATFNPDMQVVIRTPGKDVESPDTLRFIDRVGAEKHEGEWLAVISLDDEVTL